MPEPGDRELLGFPCEFPIKVMGRAEEGFEDLVVEIVRRHAPDLGEGAVQVRDSRGGNYLSVTVTIRAESRAQLDAIYRDLTGDERVLMAL
jgi:putative lipoic acid-binding regulatory protein